MDERKTRLLLTLFSILMISPFILLLLCNIVIGLTLVLNLVLDMEGPILFIGLITILVTGFIVPINNFIMTNIMIHSFIIVFPLGSIVLSTFLIKHKFYKKPNFIIILLSITFLILVVVF